jgi:DNA-binding GntR family transcriptional regulator
MAGSSKKRRPGRRKQSSKITLGDRHRLDRSSRVPLHYQLAEILKERLEAGAWEPGTLFPSERELEEHFRVSRSVIRPALAPLASDGEIRRVRGSGTFVLPPKRKVPICGLLKAVFAKPLDEIAVSILDISEHAKDDAVSGLLEIEGRGSQIVQVTAVVAVVEPVCVIDSFFAAKDFPWLLAPLEDLRDGSEAKKPAKRPMLTHSAASVESSAAVGEWTGARLKADPSSPAMVARLIQYGRPPGVGRERPVEFARLVYRADRAQLTCAGA